jgi:hypothetical protein
MKHLGRDVAPAIASLLRRTLHLPSLQLPGTSSHDDEPSPAASTLTPQQRRAMFARGRDPVKPTKR